MTKPVEILPSFLTADFGALGDQCIALERAGVDRFHWDVMDGQFVPNITLGPDVIGSCRSRVAVGFEAHLMTNRPEELLPRYAEAGVGLVLVHPETLRQPGHTYRQIRDLGMLTGVALSPATGLEAVAWCLDLIDQLLVMTVNPGFGGQSYLAAMEAKVAAARALIDDSGCDIRLEVDGGISAETIAGPAGRGADTFVVGSALWRARSFAEGVAEVRRAADDARQASRSTPA